MERLTGETLMRHPHEEKPEKKVQYIKHIIEVDENKNVQNPEDVDFQKDDRHTLIVKEDIPTTIYKGK